MRMPVILCLLLWAGAAAQQNDRGEYSLGEGNEIVVDQGVVVFPLPLLEGENLARLAIGSPDGYHFLYNPNRLTLDGVWSGQFGRVLEGGDFQPFDDRMKSFSLDRTPWSFGEHPRSPLVYEWIGWQRRGDQIVLRYRLEVPDKKMEWLVEETPEFVDAVVQRIHFKIRANQQSEEYLNYWLRQTDFRNVTANGQQNQRNLLKNLLPNQESFSIEFVRKSETSSIPHGYSLQSLEIPESVSPYKFEPTDFDFAEDGSVYVSTRTGGVWQRSPQEAGARWNLFAEGLGEANGVRVSPESTSEKTQVYVMQKPELTLLKDEDGDGVADLYLTEEDRFRFTGQYHEFAYGPRMNSKGDLFFSLGLSSGGSHKVIPDGFKGQMTTPLGYRGWVMRKSQDGTLTPFAWGLRSPAGIGMNAEDELFITDNQGDWIPASYLGHVEQGDFLGHPASAWDLPEHRYTQEEMDYRSVNERVKTVKPLDIETLRKKRKLPAVWLAHGDLTNSPGHPSFAPAEGFGPFAGQAFIADIAHRAVTRVALEKVDGQYQGAAFPFISQLPSCSYSSGFDREGNLWIGSVGRGWVAGDPSIEVIRYDPDQTPFEMQRIALIKGGFEIHFTEALSEAEVTAEMIQLTCFDYEWWETYGSEPINVTSPEVESLSVSEDRKVLTMKLPLKAEFVYQIELPKLRSQSNIGLENHYAYYTLNRLQP